MQTYKTSISREEGKVKLSFQVPAGALTIPLTEDKPNEVKEIFNSLLVELKKGKFKFELEDAKEDLYYHISKEYVTQLNAELEGAYKELSDYGLLDSPRAVETDDMGIHQN